MNEFYSDDEFQRRKRDTVLVPEFYEAFFRGRYCFFDDPQHRKYQDRGMDTFIRGEDGAYATIEEKIVRYKGRDYTAVCLETESCTVSGFEKKGWMHYSEAKVLLYCMATEDDTLHPYAFDMQKLREWFWDVGPQHWPLHVERSRNCTASRIVPLEEIAWAIGYVDGLNELVPFVERFLVSPVKLAADKAEAAAEKKRCAEERAQQRFDSASRIVAAARAQREANAKAFEEARQFAADDLRSRIAAVGKRAEIIDGYLIHNCCVCGVEASFGYGVSLLKNQLGTWYCAQHRPKP
jgi:hypothetical protein